VQQQALQEVHVVHSHYGVPTKRRTGAMVPIISESAAAVERPDSSVRILHKVYKPRVSV